MKLFAVLAAVLLEHFRPLDTRLTVYALFNQYSDTLERHFNAGERRHGVIAWSLAVLPPVLVTAAVALALARVHGLLALLFSVLVLYVTMGFKHFSNIAAQIASALRGGELKPARAALSRWYGQDAGEFNAQQIARVAIEQSLIFAHRKLFGIITWFVLLGPAGAVLYRLAHMLMLRWGKLDPAESGAFGHWAQRVFEWLDWIPERLTAISFAIVGDFEDAVYCWRAQAGVWQRPGQGIILASGAGALGVKLGDALPVSGGVLARPEVGLGDEADADYVQSAVSLIWRALVLWLAVLTLVTIAIWVGG